MSLRTWVSMPRGFLARDATALGVPSIARSRALSAIQGAPQQRPIRGRPLLVRIYGQPAEAKAAATGRVLVQALACRHPGQGR